jgi:hypothetical protein
VVFAKVKDAVAALACHLLNDTQPLKVHQKTVDRGLAEIQSCCQGRTTDQLNIGCLINSRTGLYEFNRFYKFIKRTI